jgi:hypothetical protein
MTMSGGGWVQIHRSLLEHDIWLRERFTRGQAWVDLIMLASYADHAVIQGNHSIRVHRGQVLTSQTALAKRWKWDRETVRRFFRLLESLIMCHIETSKATDTGYTLITIVNYDSYQTGQNGGSGLVPTPDAPSNAPSDPASMPHPCPTLNKGNKGNKRIAGALPASTGGDGKGARSGKKARKTHPETDTLLAEFGALFEQKWGTPYLATFARDKKLLHDILTASGVEEVRSRMTAFLKYGTKRTRDLADYSIPAFRAAWNELGVLKARGDL